MAARRPENSYRMTNEHRDKIKNSNIINVLIEHALGKREMSSTQVQAGLGLLRKVLPDLQAIGGSDEMPPVRYVARMPEEVDDLKDWIAQNAPGVSPPQ